MGGKHRLLLGEIGLEQKFDVIGRNRVLPQQQLVNLGHKASIRLGRIGKPHRIGIGVGRGLVLLAELEHAHGGLARFAKIELRPLFGRGGLRGSFNQLRAHWGVRSRHLTCQTLAKESLSRVNTG